MKPPPRYPSPSNARLEFFGSSSAETFSREIAESFQGVLTRNMITDPTDANLGFVSASIDDRPWYDTMWTRDAGVFLRELVQWGYLEHACLLAEELVKLVQPGVEGYQTFPEYFKIGQPGSGSELDGTGAIIIGLILLWERSDQHQPTRQRIESFLLGSTSPLNYIQIQLEKSPLIAGSGEFGGGCGISGEFYNVVQNNLVRIALMAAGRMCHSLGNQKLEKEYFNSSNSILQAMLAHLRDENGAWIWNIDPITLKPDPTILNHSINQGFGGINGLLSMTTDISGFSLESYNQELVEASRCTFTHLFSFPKRKMMFEKYGAWTQFDRLCNGLLTGPSYGQGYATQNMFLMDQMEMAGKAVDFLAEITQHPFPANWLDRDSDYFFYERYYLPELLENPATINDTGQFFDGKKFDQGCGALNLVCVAEPLKIARLIVGVDDHDPGQVQFIPRLPPAWNGYQAENWPILTSSGLAHYNLHCERRGESLSLDLEHQDGPELMEYKVRIPVKHGWIWKQIRQVNR